MISNDMIQSREDIRVKMQQALKNNDTDGFYQSFNEMIETISTEMQQRHDEQIDGLKAEMDSRILAARGVRQLTNREHEYYQKLTAAMQSSNPRQKLQDTDLVMPETIIDSVFEDLRTNHPLLSKIKITATTALTEFIMNANGDQEAAWGPLSGEIVQELTSGFRVIDMSMYKLSAFFAECKAMLDLGPAWFDRYIREVLYEALANGLEAGVIAGDGNNKPIGMNRQVGDDVTVTGNKYPAKAKISVNDLSPETIGNLLSLIAADPNGKPRQVRDLVLIVNPQDYFQRVMPATTLMAPDGTYRNDVMPYPMQVIQSRALERGEAILGMAYKYFAGAGMAKEGRIEYSDEYRFLEDERVYLIKLYANGFPMDNNAFLYLDISDLQPAAWKVHQVAAPAASSNAELSDIKIGGLELAPAFASDTVSYTAATTNATNTVMAIPADAGAKMDITVGAKTLDNGTAAKWADGSNTVTVKVTAADGTTTKSYTVAVTKS